MSLKTKVEQILSDCPHSVSIKDGSETIMPEVGFQGVRICLGTGKTRREMVMAEHLKDDPELESIIIQFVKDFELFVR